MTGDDKSVENLEAGESDGDIGDGKAFREARWEDGADADPVSECGALRRSSRSACAGDRSFNDDRVCDLLLSPLSLSPGCDDGVGDACEASELAVMGSELSAESGVKGPAGEF